MKKRITLIWYSLFIVCALLGFIREPEGFWKFLCVTMSIVFFIPGFCLLLWAVRRDDRQTVKRLRTVSLCSLCVTTGVLLLNFASALMSKLAGDILYGILVVVSTPMVCGQYWVVSLFLWACLLCASITAGRR